MFDWLFSKESLRNGSKFVCMLSSIMLSQFIVLILAFFTPCIAVPIVISFIISTVVSYGKVMICDKVLGGGVCDKRNFIASEIGVVYGILVSLILLLV